MKFWFTPRFNRADFYGIVVFTVAIANGAPPLMAIPILVVWAVFSAFMESTQGARR